MTVSPVRVVESRILSARPAKPTIAQATGPRVYGFRKVFIRRRPSLRVSFGEFTLDAGTRQLFRGATEVHLSPKAFQLLAILLQSRPSVVDRQTLRQQLWPDTHVVDAALGNLVAEIRSAFSPDGAALIRTAHGVGYAFTGEAREAVRSSPVGEDARSLPRCWLVWNERNIVLEASECIVGRDPTCVAWIDAPGVSRRHARIAISRRGGDVVATIEDLDSTNGTYVNGRPISKATEISDGTRLTFGDATLTFRAWRDVDTATKRVRPRDVSPRS
jgi:DNA-binding winged helix-turn-helix (wHTH) protein